MALAAQGRGIVLVESCIKVAGVSPKFDLRVFDWKLSFVVTSSFVVSSRDKRKFLVQLKTILALPYKMAATFTFFEVSPRFRFVIV